MTDESIDINEKSEKAVISFKDSQELNIKAFDEYIRIYRKKKAIIGAVIFGILALLFVDQVIVKPRYGLGWTCLAISLFMAVMSLVSPTIERKRITGILKETKESNNILRIFETEISAESYDEGKLLLKKTVPLLEKSVVIIEKTDYYAVFSEDLYMVIPKSELDANADTALKELAAKTKRK